MRYGFCSEYKQLPGSLSAVGLANFLMLLAGCLVYLSAYTQNVWAGMKKGFPLIVYCSSFRYAVLLGVSVCGNTNSCAPHIQYKARGSGCLGTAHG